MTILDILCLNIIVVSKRMFFKHSPCWIFKQKFDTGPTNPYKHSLMGVKWKLEAHLSMYHSLGYSCTV